MKEDLPGEAARLRHGYWEQWYQGSTLTDTQPRNEDYIIAWGAEHAIATGHLRLEAIC